MEILLHSHRASVSDRMTRRAEVAVGKLARRLTRAVSAVIRFEEDGRMRRVEIVLHSAGARPLVAEGIGRYFGTALAAALAHMETQAAHLRRPAKERVRRAARAGQVKR